MRRYEGVDVADQIYQGAKREPVWRVLLFDRSDPLYKVVLGNYTQAPRDVTGNLQGSLNISESDSAATTLTATFTATFGLTPNHFLGRPIIIVQESDRHIMAEYGEVWLTMFLGPVTGQPGYTYRGREEMKSISVSAIDRSFFYNKKSLVTRNFDEDEDFGDIGVEIGIDTEWGMGLQREEIDFGKKDYDVKHTYISIRETPYMEGLNLLFFILNLKAVFSSDGKLTLRDRSLAKPPVRIYQNYDTIRHIKWVAENVEIINQVRVIGLDSDTTKQSYPRQRVSTSTGTLGYFTEKWKETVYYSEDKTQRAESPQVEEFEMNGWLSSVSQGDVEIVVLDEFSFELRIKCPYNLIVFIVFFIVYVVLYVAAAVVGFFYPSAAFIIYTAASIWLCVGLGMMQQLGQFTVEVSAIPYQILYREYESVASWSHLEDYETREKEVRNHLINTQALCDSIAERELEIESIKAHPRSISILHDPLPEPDDIIEMRDGSRYYIQSISRRYSRDEVSMMGVRAWLINGETSDA